MTAFERPQRLKRNALCHCGSGLKYKKCHLESDRALQHAAIDAVQNAKRNDITAEGYSSSEIGISQRGFDKLRETPKGPKKN